jgi:hypothetical protein
LAENIDSVNVTLTTAELARIDKVSRQVRGERKNEAGMQLIDG